MSIDVLANNYLFELDDYSQLKVTSEKEALTNLIVDIILGDEYQVPTVNDKTGLNIKRFRFEFIEESISTIQAELKELIEKNIPNNLVKDIIVAKKDNHTIAIGIEFTVDMISGDPNASIEDRISLVQISENEDGYDIKTV